MSNMLTTLKEFFQTYNKLESGEVVLDVRRQEEFEEARIKNAINIPHEEVLNHLEELKTYKRIFIHCKRGGRAKMAYDALSAAGLDNLVCVHDAGMDAWIENGYPVERN